MSKMYSYCDFWDTVQAHIFPVKGEAWGVYDVLVISPKGSWILREATGDYAYGFKEAFARAEQMAGLRLEPYEMRYKPMKSAGKSKKLIAAAKKALKASTRIDGYWNHWLSKDGTLHAEYQCGTDALFTLEKRGKKVSLVGVNK